MIVYFHQRFLPLFFLNALPRPSILFPDGFKGFSIFCPHLGLLTNCGTVAKMQCENERRQTNLVWIHPYLLYVSIGENNCWIERTQVLNSVRLVEINTESTEERLSIHYSIGHVRNLSGQEFTRLPNRIFATQQLRQDNVIMYATMTSVTRNSALAVHYYYFKTIIQIPLYTVVTGSMSEWTLGLLGSTSKSFICMNYDSPEIINPPSRSHGAFQETFSQSS